MDSMTSPPMVNMMIGGQRSNNTTPHHHYYSTPTTEQPSSFMSTHSYGGADVNNPRSSSHHHSNSRRGSNILQQHLGVSPSPIQHPPSSRATPSAHHQSRSRGQSPGVNSLGPESAVMMDINTPSASQHHIHHHPHSTHVPGGSHLISTSSPHHAHPHLVGMGHNHLHDDSHIHINCDNSSHSISPPNSNSNTTISCGSGNSTSANIGVPTTRGLRTSGVGGEAPNPPSHNNNNIGSNRQSHHNKNSKESGVMSEDYENYRNSRARHNKNRSSGSGKGHPRKKSILEDDCEKSGVGGCSISSSGMEDDDNSVRGCNNRKFKQRPPFINPNQEFLPICDALFNMISLAAYFCDVVFDVLTVYTWYKMSVETEEDLFELSYQAVQQTQKNRLLISSGEVDERVSTMPKELMWQWSLLGVVFIALSCCLSQLMSFKWYKESERRGQKAPDGSYLEGPPAPCSNSILVAMHLSLVGVLWRYFKLFIPVDLRFVKNEVRDLCLLRLIHAFCQAAPMLLLQLYLIWHEPGLDRVSDLMKVSTCLSLFSVCWALASFSKHIRRQNVHKLVLTWLGVIFQFFWRLGTVTSRFLALSLYAMAYQYWVFVVLFLHWFCMLLWLISPKNIFHGEKMSPVKKVSYSAIVAVVYTFCYINVQETNSRIKVVIYYVTMLMENSLLLGVWLIAVRYEDEIWYRSAVTYAVYLCFFGGLFFMGLYYKYFHVKKLSYVYDAESSIYRNTSSIGGCSLINDNGSMVATITGGDYDLPGSVARGKSNGVIMGYSNRSSTGINGNNGSSIYKKKQKSNNNNQDQKKKQQHPSKKSSSDNQNESGTTNGAGGKLSGQHIHHPNMPGVFNCRFHPAMKRKKKKPTSFVPPPAVQQNNGNNGTPSNNGTPATANNNAQPLSATAAAAQMMMLSSPKNTNEVVVPEQAIPEASTSMMTTMMMRQQDNSLLLRSTPQGQEGDHEERPPHHHLHQHHQNHNLSHGSHHHHLVVDNHYDVNTTSGAATNCSRLSPHYDLPEEYDPNCSSTAGGIGMPGGGSGSHNGSAASSASALYGMYPVMKGANGRMMVPFWRRPLSLTMGSENEGSVSSRIDIQQKLQEKKQQQLAELREIEEEIKQGKLKRPELHEMIPEVPMSGRPTIPVEKKQPWFGGDEGQMLNGQQHLHGEILLDPQQYLMYGQGQMASPAYQMMDNGSGFYYNPDWPPVVGQMPNYYEPLYQNDDDCCMEGPEEEDSVSALGGMRGEGDGEGDTSPPSGGGGMSGDSKGGKGGRLDRRRRGRVGVGGDNLNKSYFDPSSRESIYKSYRIPSDIDSQMSLPRSYTLPTKFKYKRKFRKPVQTENFLPSTNSSDGKGKYSNIVCAVINIVRNVIILIKILLLEHR